ncbi:unnamed protein product [Cyprideis torosa]|uniref:Sulfatase N-terminal domain-containing protein n=1 Tax=Cyprideis torosa TaxID=163714 RepID=A0A7R8WC48_9CRUS|nr:unnamed protein product [Cyprideis torosa]CAG0887666.1 unnamed protein product [Cyprideis torosa]
MKLNFQSKRKEASESEISSSVADDAGKVCSMYDSASSSGSKTVCNLPNFAKLRKRSTLFESAFTTVSSCSPSRSTILTGLPAHQNGMYGLHHNLHHFSSFSDVRSLPRILRNHKISTGIIGKKHVGPLRVYPFEFSYTEEDGYSTNQVGRNITFIKELVRRFLHKRVADGRPFFLEVAFHDPHRCRPSDKDFGPFCNKFGNGQPGMGSIPDWTPVEYDPDQLTLPSFVADTPAARQDLAAYYTTISRLDQGIGLVLQELEEAGFTSNTLVIYTSDNGPPFLMGRTNLYEPGIAIPLSVSHPQQPSSWNQLLPSPMVTLLDLTPTILHWFGIRYPPYALQERLNHTSRTPIKLTGRSLLPELSKTSSNTSSSTDAAVFLSHTFHEVTMAYPMRGIRTKDLKAILNLAHPIPFPIDQDFFASPSFQDFLNRTVSGIPTNINLTLNQYYFRPLIQVFNVSEGVETDVTKTLASDIVLELTNRIRNWQWETSDPWVCYPWGVLEGGGADSGTIGCRNLFPAT